MMTSYPFIHRIRLNSLVDGVLQNLPPSLVRGSQLYVNSCIGEGDIIDNTLKIKSYNGRTD